MHAKVSKRRRKSDSTGVKWDELTSDNNSYSLEKKNEIYLICLHPGQKTTGLDLGDSGKEFTISWFDPRNGKLYDHGSVPSVVASQILPRIVIKIGRC